LTEIGLMKSSNLDHLAGRLEALTESAPDAILTIDEASTIISANPATERIFGYTPEEIVGRSLTALIPERFRAAHSAGVAHYLRTGRRNIPWTGFQLPGLTKGGREIPLEISFGEFIDENGRHLFSGFVRDVSDRVRQQEALAEREKELHRLNRELEERAQEERALRTLAQSITGAVRVSEVMHEIAVGALAVSEAAGAFVEQVVEPNGNVEVVAASGKCTPAVGQCVPYPGSLTQEIIDRREPVFLVRMQGIGAAMAPYLDKQCHGCSVLVVPLLAGTRVLGALVLLRLPEEAAFEHGIVTRLRTLGDLASLSLQRLIALAESDRRRQEAEAAVRLREEVLSIVSHDLRNPVSTVAMSASLLKDSAIELDEAERVKQLDIIVRAAQRMNRLIQDLLDVARIEGGRFAVSCRCEDPGALASEAYDVFRSLAAEKSLQIDCRVEPKLPPVNVDRDRVIQALSNFLNNAIKFTPPGGRITIGITPHEARGVRFFVSDTGPGIPHDELPYLFNHPWQAKRTAHLGAGLGLTISKGIAVAHGGDVWAESTPGVGSTFCLSIPHSDICSQASDSDERSPKAG
jgi:PAS domain S-box-containing protein